LMRAAGVSVDALGATRLFNLAALWRLRRLVREYRPDVVHTWGRPSLWAVALAAASGAHALAASSPFLPGKDRGTPSRLDRWLLRRVDRILVSGPAAAERCCRLGLAAGRVAIVPPGVETSSAERSVASVLGTLNCPRTIVCAGPLEIHKGFLEAIWAFDILQYVFVDLHFVLAGTGPDRDRLERFVALAVNGRRVHLVGSQADLGNLLARAEVVWVPSLAEGGVNLALEAMALGRPVVASRLPGLAEIIADGETGLLVTPGSKVELCRQTRRLLDDAGQRHLLGAAGRHRAATHFAAADFVRRCADLYRRPKEAA